MEILQLFTDGGGFDKGNGKFRAVSSFRMFKDDYLVHDGTHVEEDRTNVYGEIRGIADALVKAEEYTKADTQIQIVKLYTDSMLCLNSLTKWIFGWIRNQRNGVFYASGGKPVMNQEEIKRAFRAMQQLRERKIAVKLYHINSHMPLKDVQKQHQKFMQRNLIQLSFDEFMFIYLQNKKCDAMIQQAHAEYIEKQKPQNI